MIARQEPLREILPSALKRPGLVAIVWAFHLLAGLAMALPLASGMGRSVAHYPNGDAALFAPGGVMLAEMARINLPSIGPSVLGSMLTFVAASLLGVLPLSLLLAGLDRAGSRGLVREAGGHAGTVAMLWGTATFASFVMGVVITLVGGVIVGKLKLLPQSEAIAFGVVALVAALAALLVSLVRDMAYVAAAREGHGFYRAAERAFGALKASTGRVVGLFAASRIAAWIALALGAYLAPLRAGTALWGFLLHAIALLVAISARAGWLGAAMRTLDESAPAKVIAPRSEA